MQSQHERLVVRFGSSNERVMALMGLVKEAQASNHSELEKVLAEYDVILQETPSNIVSEPRSHRVDTGLNR